MSQINVVVNMANLKTRHRKNTHKGTLEVDKSGEGEGRPKPEPGVKKNGKLGTQPRRSASTFHPRFGPPPRPYKRGFFGRRGDWDKGGSVRLGCGGPEGDKRKGWTGGAQIEGRCVGLEDWGTRGG